MFFKRKNRGKKEEVKLQAPDVVVSFRYTYDTWKKHLPQGTQLQYEYTVYPNNLLMYLSKFITLLDKKIEISDNTKYVIVPIDNEYFEYIKGNNLEDNAQSQTAFANSLNYDEVYTLFKKYNWDEEYELLGIPFYAINLKTSLSNKTSFKLDDEMKSHFNEYLEKIYGENNVYVPGYILTHDAFHTQARTFLQLASVYFKDNQKLRFIKWEEQKFLNENPVIYPLVIPFAIRRKYKSAILELNKLFKDPSFMPSLRLTKENVEELNLSCPPLKESKPYNIIKEYFGQDTVILESIIRYQDIYFVNNEIIKKLSDKQ